MYEPVRTAGTYAATGAVTGGSVSPSAASRSAGPLTLRPPLACRSRLFPLQIGDQLLGVGSGDDGDELPPVVTPVVQDLLGRVHQQRHRRVLPLWHGPALRLVL